MTFREAVKILDSRVEKDCYPDDLFIETFDDAESIIDAVEEWLEAVQKTTPEEHDVEYSPSAEYDIALQNAIDTCNKLCQQLNDLYNNRNYYE